ncbi:MAG TPA: 4Fe-4S binding protein [Anaerolineales bacterium]|nr:4Fe-4S binding protein [Anaerolineales bacterium]
MRLGAMLGDILPSLFRAPVTELYPFTRREPPTRLRGLLHWDRESCTGCGMCATDCPSQAIELFTYDKKAKRFVFELHVDRCTFCGQCAVSCRQGSLALTKGNWELAAFDRGTLDLHFGEKEDVDRVLRGDLPQAAPTAEPAGG